MANKPKQKTKRQAIPLEEMDRLRSEMKPEPKRRGQPTKYDPKFCEMIIEHLSQGYSMESFAGVVSVSRDTIYEWRDKHPSFSDSINIGLSKSLLFWEKLGTGGTVGKLKGFNCSSWIFSMKNRFKWTDRTETNVNGNLNVAPTVIFGIDSDDDAKD